MKIIFAILILIMASSPRCLAELVHAPGGRLIYFDAKARRAFVVDLDKADTPIACLISDDAKETGNGIRLASGKRFLIDPDSLESLHWEKIESMEVAFPPDAPRTVGDTLYVNLTKRLQVSILRVSPDGDVSYHFSRIVEQSVNPKKTILRDCLFVVDPFADKFPKIGTSRSFSVEEKPPAKKKAGGA